MNLSDISTQLLYTTVPLWVERAHGSSFGTAFLFSIEMKNRPGESIPFMVTNAHVVDGARRGLIEVTQREGDQPARGKRIRVDFGADILSRYVDSANDLAAVPIGGVINSLEKEGRGAFFRTIDASLVPASDVWEGLSAIEEVTFIGYPSGLYDQHNSSPLVRRGITATPPWNDYANTPSFLVDAGVFPGSSGSPVFILNRGAYSTGNGLAIGSRLFFVGILSESIVRREATVPDVFLGLGKALKSTVVLSFLKGVATQLAPALESSSAEA